MRRLVILLLTGFSAFGENLPLFTIEKNTNANRVLYEARITSEGRLDPHQPVIAYWIMAAEDGRRQELNFFEKAKAYGFTIRPDKALDSFRLYVVSHRQKEIHVYRDGGGVRAVAMIGGHLAYLRKIFITTHKTWILSLPDYGEMYGSDVVTGEPRYEKVLSSDR